MGANAQPQRAVSPGNLECTAGGWAGNKDQLHPLGKKIGPGGQVLPHYHDVAEIIHITVGKVKLLCNGEWKNYQAGDTFHVPAGTVHSVLNDDIVPSEQISIFLPVEEAVPPNQFF